MKFFEGGIAKLAVSALTKDAPVYVQFYVTARCNLACEQCNVIYANADQEECTTEQAWRIAENLAKIGTSIVLLTGGEPFVRKDLCEIAQAMIANGIHPRLQTNGLATPRQLEKMVQVGAHDISVSLDSVVPSLQNTINGGFNRSWMQAMSTIALINTTFPEDSFCALGCVIAPRNLEHVTSVIRFATEIGWWVSLVPAHQTSIARPRSFATFDEALKFPAERYGRVREVLDSVKDLRNAGLNVYDSDEYLDDIYRFIVGEPVRWRRRNGGLCDSPNLYFAITPNGEMEVCCDYRLDQSYPVFAPEFLMWYRSSILREEVEGFTRNCSGCMYGSFPEITISARFLAPMLRRARLFATNAGDRRLKRYSAAQMIALASKIGVASGVT
jgi:MoaA/NifB/PqqE/SkfB family radical SAM enzyme